MPDCRFGLPEKPSLDRVMQAFFTYGPDLLRQLSPESEVFLKRAELEMCS